MSVLSKYPGMPRRLNPVLKPVARWLLPLAVLHHTGRTSGRTFDTPVQAFRTKSKTGFIVGLAYDNEANWALNILAAGGGSITRGGRDYDLTAPRRRGPEATDELPGPIAFMMRKLGIDSFVEFDATRT